MQDFFLSSIHVKGFRASIPASLAKGNRLVAESGNTSKTTGEMAAAA